ncbi:glycosyltransferase [Kocuria sp. LHG3120]|uniref:glycosyltransferase n=1 Tax=Kocuria sp. LHG3120 TaxID=2804590 RepID=UPI003CF09358
MKILQVVTYISPDGAYGGPVRVALNQAKALSKLGHEVVIAAAAGGFQGPLPVESDGFPVRLFQARKVLPRTGFAGLSSPGLLRWLAANLKDFDVLHVHLARDLVTLPAAALSLQLKVPFVVQTHGMIDPTQKKLAGPLDRHLTKPVLKAARSVFYLTERERQSLTDVAGKLHNLRYLPNGVDVPTSAAIEQGEGPQQNPEVLFLARLHSIKRPSLMVNAARDLEKAFPSTQFTLVGPDEGEASHVSALIHSSKQENRVHWAGPLPPEETLSRMCQASVYALPSSAEVFPMSVLEAMSVGLPVIVTDGCGLAPMITENSAGVVCDQTPKNFSKAVEELLRQPERRVVMGSNARRAVKELHSITRVAKNLLYEYEKAYKPQGANK